MAARIRSLVSKNKRRFQEDGFDLDLSYIRPNIIAMGFPAEKLEGVFRNHIDDVVRFLETKHKDHYKIYNLCNERYYNVSRFNNRVANYPFVDHQPPSLEDMLPFCEDVHQWLSQDPRNVVAVHCKAGKGRTGVMICAYLLYTGEFSSAETALQYYGKQRTVDMNGVTIPSQRRYVNYFACLLRNDVQYCVIPMVLQSIELECPPGFDRTIFNPQFVVYSRRTVFKWNPCLTVQNGNRLLMALPVGCLVAGDVRVEFFHKLSRLHKERLFHFWFNTFFLHLDKAELAGRIDAAQTDQGTLEPAEHSGSGLPKMKARECDGVHELRLSLSDLDQLKSKSQKIFNENFKVCVYLRYASSGSDGLSCGCGLYSKCRPKVSSSSCASDQSDSDRNAAEMEERFQHDAGRRSLSPCGGYGGDQKMETTGESSSTCFHDKLPIRVRTTPTSISV